MSDNSGPAPERRGTSSTVGVPVDCDRPPASRTPDLRADDAPADRTTVEADRRLGAPARRHLAWCSPMPAPPINADLVLAVAGWSCRDRRGPITQFCGALRSR